VGIIFKYFEEYEGDGIPGFKMHCLEGGGFKKGRKKARKKLLASPVL